MKNLDLPMLLNYNQERGDYSEKGINSATVYCTAVDRTSKCGISMFCPVV